MGNDKPSTISRQYMFFGIDIAMQMLRPGAKWEISNTKFTRWDDPRPCPSWEEVQDTMVKIKALEDSINTVWLPEQIEEMAKHSAALNEAIGQ